MEATQVNRRIKKSSIPPFLKKTARIVSNIVFALLLLLMCLLVFSLVQSRVTGGPPSVIGYQIYIVLSGSMSPTFDAGSVVFVRPLPPEEIRVGDILTYKVRGGDSIVTHRVVEIVEEDGKLGFITRGDANDVNDEGILEPERVIGRVNYYLPYLGRLMTFTQTKQGLLTLVFIPGILIIIYELKNILQYAVAMEKEKQAKAEAAAESSEEQPLP